MKIAVLFLLCASLGAQTVKPTPKPALTTPLCTEATGCITANAWTPSSCDNCIQLAPNYSFSVITVESGSLMRCGGSEDKPTGCVIAEGHTLDEVVAAILKSTRDNRKAQEDKYEGMRLFALDALEQDRIAFVKIQADMKEIQTDLAGKRKPKGNGAQAK